MKHHLLSFKEYLKEAKDPTYYQETFYFTILISMSKDIGGSRDETKNDIRALPEILTVTLVEPEKGGVQRDMGTKYLSTLKVHVRKPKNVNKAALMKKVVLFINSLRGITVLRYKEKKAKPRRKAFHGKYSVTEGDYYQSSKHMKDVMGDAAALTKGGPQKKGGSPFNRMKPEKKWKSAPPGAPGGLEETATEDKRPLSNLSEDILIAIGGTEPNDVMDFDLQPALQPKIWNEDDQVRRGVKGALMDIVDEFLEKLELDADVKDILLTGSMANYNWSKFSDIDIHILMNFAEINDNEVLVKKFFDAVRSRWNKLHNIYVKGHEVELYVQDEHEPHTSTGVYSLSNDEWLVKPQRIEPQIDEATAFKKMNGVIKELDKLRSLYNNDLYEDSFELAQRLKEKISRMRKGGLRRSGIYSPENIAFKMLRRTGAIEDLFDIYTKSYDAVYSLDQ